MLTLSTVSELRELTAGGARVGLVPTMGALHHGHAALIEAAKSETDWVVLSIFVNPLQFGPGEDFGRYPRQPQADKEFAAAAGVDCLFTPSSAEMYGEQGSEITIEVGALGQVLCGAARPGHFAGVATVVAKLLNIAGPHVAFFGEKDYQQLVIVRAVAERLSFPVEIVGVPTVRDADGLAVSSRNAYLNDDERTSALAIPRALDLVDRLVADGETSARTLTGAARDALDSATGVELEYFTICDTVNLRELEIISGEALVAIAAKVGGTRLIDNHVVKET